MSSLPTLAGYWDNYWELDYVQLIIPMNGHQMILYTGGEKVISGQGVPRESKVFGHKMTWSDATGSAGEVNTVGEADFLYGGPYNADYSEYDGVVDTIYPQRTYRLHFWWSGTNGDKIISPGDTINVSATVHDENPASGPAFCIFDGNKGEYSVLDGVWAGGNRRKFGMWSDDTMLQGLGTVAINDPYGSGSISCVIAHHPSSNASWTWKHFAPVLYWYFKPLSKASIFIPHTVNPNPSYPIGNPTKPITTSPPHSPVSPTVPSIITRPPYNSPNSGGVGWTSPHPHTPPVHPTNPQYGDCSDCQADGKVITSTPYALGFANSSGQPAYFQYCDLSRKPLPPNAIKPYPYLIGAFRAPVKDYGYETTDILMYFGFDKDGKLVTASDPRTYTNYNDGGQQVSLGGYAIPVSRSNNIATPTDQFNTYNLVAYTKSGITSFGSTGTGPINSSHIPEKWIKDSLGSIVFNPVTLEFSSITLDGTATSLSRTITGQNSEVSPASVVYFPTNGGAPILPLFLTTDESKVGWVNRGSGYSSNQQNICYQFEWSHKPPVTGAPPELQKYPVMPNLNPPPIYHNTGNSYGTLSGLGDIIPIYYGQGSISMNNA